MVVPNYEYFFWPFTRDCLLVAFLKLGAVDLFFCIAAIATFPKLFFLSGRTDENRYITVFNLFSFFELTVNDSIPDY